jgi:hypothetical protein
MPRWMLVGFVGLVACATSPDDGEVTGPYSGPIRRYEIDDFKLPSNNNQARELGRDLNGDRTADNTFGMLTGTLSAWNDLATARDTIGSGLVRSVIEVQADDLLDDDSVALWYIGADGNAASALGARLHDGTIISNPIHTSQHQAEARVHLPVFIDADPTILDLLALEIELQPDGAGGFTGFLYGALRSEDAVEAAYRGIAQMMVTDPAYHRSLRYMFDVNHDGVIQHDEIANSSLIQSLFAPDVTIPGLGRLMSFGVSMHLRSCEDTTCQPVPVVDACHDRVKDGSETDLDCGGGCVPCPEGRTCTVGGDCDSQTCASTTCTAPSCSDGIENGFEADLDCGGICTTRCATGQQCIEDLDCVSQNCFQGKCGWSPP